MFLSLGLRWWGGGMGVGGVIRFLFRIGVGKVIWDIVVCFGLWVDRFFGYIFVLLLICYVVLGKLFFVF